MIEISDETRAARVRARLYMRQSLIAFAKVALLCQDNPKLLLDGYGRMASAMYRAFRITHKFWECV